MGEEELAEAATVVCVVEVEFMEVDGPGVRAKGPGNEPDGLSCEFGNHPVGAGVEGFVDDFRGVHPVEHEGDLLVRDHAPVTMPPDVVRQLTDHRDVIGAGDAQDGRREGRAFGGWNGVRHERGDHAVGPLCKRGRRKGERGGDVLIAVGRGFGRGRRGRRHPVSYGGSVTMRASGGSPPERTGQPSGV